MPRKSGEAATAFSLPVCDSRKAGNNSPTHGILPDVGVCIALRRPVAGRSASDDVILTPKTVVRAQIRGGRLWEEAVFCRKAWKICLPLKEK